MVLGPRAGWPRALEGISFCVPATFHFLPPGRPSGVHAPPARAPAARLLITWRLAGNSPYVPCSNAPLRGGWGRWRNPREETD